jgi:hypothetical protein
MCCAVMNLIGLAGVTNEEYTARPEFRQKLTSISLVYISLLAGHTSWIPFCMKDIFTHLGQYTG